jgi:hypothetical protein
VIGLVVGAVDLQQLQLAVDRGRQPDALHHLVNQAESSNAVCADPLRHVELHSRHRHLGSARRRAFPLRAPQAPGDATLTDARLTLAILTMTCSALSHSKCLLLFVLNTSNIGGNQALRAIFRLFGFQETIGDRLIED